MKKGRCPKCGSKDVMANVVILDDGRNGSHPLRVVVAEPEPPKHAAIWVQGQSEGELQAWICARCGYTEIYASSLDKLSGSYRKGH